MSLQRRLLVYLLLCAPLAWALALWVSIQRAQDEVNQLFDTEIIRLARQVQATLASVATAGGATSGTGTGGAAGDGRPLLHDAGEADLRDLAVAVWNRQGQLALVDREGAQLPRLVDTSGFADLVLGGQAWRVYYLPSAQGQWLVAAGQRKPEREALVWGLIGGQILPWVLMLPLLMASMTWAVRQALRPVRTLADEVRHRDADALQRLRVDRAPVELQPLLEAMNGLFDRIESALARERRFTADAAHELRTPLAALRLQWDVLRHARDEGDRRHAEQRLATGLERLDRLVAQMLSMSRVDATERLQTTVGVDWPAVVEQVFGDVLPLAARRGVELDCEWRAPADTALPLRGDPDLLAVMLRNLVDNAVRHAPEHSAVAVRFERDRLMVENTGAPLAPETLERLGERFFRPEGSREGGSGLGVSIVQRIAALHGLALRYGTLATGEGVVAELVRQPAARPR